MLPRLTIYQLERPAVRVMLDASRKYVLGRDPACALFIDDTRLSRRHARFEFDGSGWRLVDLCSKNGTLVDGRPVSDCELVDGQWLDFGGVLTCFQLISEEARDREEEQQRERWQSSVEQSRGMTPSLGLDALLERVLRSFVEVAGAERGYVVLADSAGQLEVDTSVPSGQGGFAGSRTVVSRALATGRPVLCSDVRTDTLLVKQASIVGGNIAALACLPLTAGQRLLGVVYVDSREKGKVYTDIDLEILQALADHAALVIGVLRVRRQLGELEKSLPGELCSGETVDPELLARLQELPFDNDGDAAGRAQAVAVVDSTR